MQVLNTCALFVVETVINYYAYQNCVCRADMATSHSAFNLAALRRDSSPNTTAFPWYDLQGAARSRCEVRHAYILAIDASYISEFNPATQWDESQPFLSCFGGERKMFIDATIDLRYCLWDAAKNIAMDSCLVGRIVEVDLQMVGGCIVNLSTVRSAQAMGLGASAAESAAWRSALALSYVPATALTGRKWCIDVVASREQRDKRKVANLLCKVFANDAEWYGYTLKNYGSYKRWIEAFDAKFPTTEEINQLLGQMAQHESRRYDN